MVVSSAASETSGRCPKLPPRGPGARLDHLLGVRAAAPHRHRVALAVDRHVRVAGQVAGQRCRPGSCRSAVAAAAARHVLEIDPTQRIDERRNTSTARACESSASAGGEMPGSSTPPSVRRRLGSRSARACRSPRSARARPRAGTTGLPELSRINPGGGRVAGRRRGEHRRQAHVERRRSGARHVLDRAECAIGAAPRGLEELRGGGRVLAPPHERRGATRSDRDHGDPRRASADVPARSATFHWSRPRDAPRTARRWTRRRPPPRRRRRCPRRRCRRSGRAPPRARCPRPSAPTAARPPAGRRRARRGSTRTSPSAVSIFQAATMSPRALAATTGSGGVAVEERGRVELDGLEPRAGRRGGRAHGEAGDRARDCCEAAAGVHDAPPWRASRSRGRVSPSTRARRSVTFLATSNRVHAFLTIGDTGEASLHAVSGPGKAPELHPVPRGWGVWGQVLDLRRGDAATFAAGRTGGWETR